MAPTPVNVNFAHGHTYAAFPLANAVGLETINILEEEQLPQRARKLGVYLRQRLEGLKRHGIVREVRGRGILLGVEIVADRSTNKPFLPRTVSATHSKTWLYGTASSCASTTIGLP